MKKKTLLLSLLTLFTLSSCNVASLDYNEFFTTNYLEGLNLFNMPTLSASNTRLKDKKYFYFTTTEEEFNKYSADMFKYLKERESMDYVVYKGEKKSDLLDDSYNRYNVHSSAYLENYRTPTGYQFIFSFDDLNEDSSLSVAFDMSLNYYGVTQSNPELGEDFTYNACMSITGVDNAHYLFYTV